MPPANGLESPKRGKRQVFAFKKARRVSIVQERPGVLVVEIQRNNGWFGYLLMLVAFTAVFLFMSYIFVSPLFRRPIHSNALFLLNPIIFLIVLYVLALRVGAWRAFGKEQIVLEDGVLRWTRTALFWKRNLEIPAKDITAVNPVTPWHGQSNRVEFAAHGKRKRIGDMLARDETWELAYRLRHQLGITEWSW